jgi:translation initiation factor IF-1
MKQSHISVIAGDWVKVEVNQYDMSQWRIVYRYNPATMHQNQEASATWS